MKQTVIIKYILSVAFLLVFVASLAQQAEPPEPDDEFNLFLLALASVFACAMIGAAIIGAAAASLIVLALAGLTALGILSTSLTVALYKRSISAGFKTLLIFVFSISGSALGVASVFIAGKLFDLAVSISILFGLGFTGGALSGVFMAIATYKVIQALFHALAKRFHTV